LEAIEKMSGVTPDGLKVVDMPCSIEYIWSHYVSMKGVGEVNYQSIDSYSRLTSSHLTPYEVGMIVDFEKVHKRVMQ